MTLSNWTLICFLLLLLFFFVYFRCSMSVNKLKLKPAISYLFILFNPNLNNSSKKILKSNLLTRLLSLRLGIWCGICPVPGYLFRFICFCAKKHDLCLHWKKRSDKFTGTCENHIKTIQTRRIMKTLGVTYKIHQNEDILT